ncbi:hypothetical protein L2E82_14773 [Cichorium intybus]|uniref:Uncharacterized protein n=1 Tax=Cichorium intybus TaxID=13427 RepID=A0ACB9F264_CICIN|nr:hypothetical protein L2E82_14773 [Cichorium intybus]
MGCGAWFYRVVRKIGSGKEGVSVLLELIATHDNMMVPASGLRNETLFSDKIPTKSNYHFPSLNPTRFSCCAHSLPVSLLPFSTNGAESTLDKRLCRSDVPFSFFLLQNLDAGGIKLHRSTVSLLPLNDKSSAGQPLQPASPPLHVFTFRQRAISNRTKRFKVCRTVQPSVTRAFSVLEAIKIQHQEEVRVLGADLHLITPLLIVQTVDMHHINLVMEAPDLHHMSPLLLVVDATQLHHMSPRRLVVLHFVEAAYLHHMHLFLLFLDLIHRHCCLLLILGG